MQGGMGVAGERGPGCRARFFPMRYTFAAVRRIDEILALT